MTVARARELVSQVLSWNRDRGDTFYKTLGPEYEEALERLLLATESEESGE